MSEHTHAMTEAQLESLVHALADHFADYEPSAIEDSCWKVVIEFLPPPEGVMDFVGWSDAINERGDR